MAKTKYKSKLAKVLEEHKCKKDHVPFEPSVNDCEKWFRILNRELFDNELPPVNEFDLRWRRNALAYYCYEMDTENKDYSLCQIAMNKRYQSKKLFVEVLAHEMVHHWQYINGERMGHGSSFLQWRDKFNKKGLNLVKVY